MGIIVQKFGGTSVANAEKIRVAARRAIRAQQNGNQVVMVVSAMGHQTDVLVDLAKQITDDPSGREMDMLLSTGEQVSVALMAMAIHSLGGKAVSLTGAQIGIRTDSSHTKARIQSISTERMKKLLDDGKIVIAAGFQGIDDDFNITTLGRGGSDTTAVALAAVLQCRCLRDLHRRRRRVHDRSAARRRGPQDGPREPRRDSRARQPRRRRHAQPLDRVRQEVQRADPRVQQPELQRRARHVIGSESGVGRPRGQRRGAHEERSRNHDRRRARSRRARATRFSRSSPASTWRST